MRMTLRLAEWFLCNQGYKKENYMGSGKRERKAIKLGPTPLTGDQEEKWDITGSGILLKSKGFKPHIRHFSPGIWHQEDESPWLD